MRQFVRVFIIINTDLNLKAFEEFDMCNLWNLLTFWHLLAYLWNWGSDRFQKMYFLPWNTFAYLWFSSSLLALVWYLGDSFLKLRIIFLFQNLYCGLIELDLFEVLSSHSVLMQVFLSLTYYFNLRESFIKQPTHW